MKAKKEKKIIKSKKRIFIIITVVLICLLIFIPIFQHVAKINKENKKVNDDYSYTFLCLVTVQEVEGIDTITYQKDGKEITVNGNGKQKVAIDFKAVENTDYEFKIKPIGKSEKTKILNQKRKFSGEGTYKLVNGVYVNTPFMDNFNKKYTRYLKPKDDQTLEPSNWIYDSEPDNWYDYNNQKWANVYVEAEGVEAYYVWVPRYVC